jgi:hypothetical protein
MKGHLSLWRTLWVWGWNERIIDVRVSCHVKARGIINRHTGTGRLREVTIKSNEARRNMNSRFGPVSLLGLISPRSSLHSAPPSLHSRSLL